VRFVLTALVCAGLLLAACSKAPEEQAPPPASQPPSSAKAPATDVSAPAAAEESTPTAPAEATSAEASPAAPSLASKVWKDDLDAMKERHAVRMLVPYSKTFYFLDKGQQHGSTYELGVQFEKELNATNKDKTQPIHVVFIPTTRDELLPAIAAGRGDIAAGNLTVTPERLEIVNFSPAIASNVKEILVTTAGSQAPTSAEGLSGTTLYVRPSSSYYASLQALNERLKAQGQAPVKIEAADESLEDEDILEMVNAGLVTATIVDSHIADFWGQIFDKIQTHPEVSVREEGQIAWAYRKDSPQMKAALEAFIPKVKIGTATGNIIAKRYFQNTKWARNATAQSDMQRFSELTKYFQKYGQEYDFEWLMLVAQGYQESGLDQSIKSPAGALGIMQMLPSTAKDRNVAIPDITQPESNIHAGVKYLRFLVDQYFDEPGISPTDRLLFAFAGYNAGPNRITRLRTEAAAEGLDPNKWFNNVERIAAKDIGRETVQYVGNIYKYYIAYKLVIQREEERAAAKQASS